MNSDETKTPSERIELRMKRHFEDYPWLKPVLGILLIWILIKYTNILDLVFIFIQIFLLPVFFLWLIGVVGDDIWEYIGQLLSDIKKYVQATTLTLHRKNREESSDA